MSQQWNEAKRLKRVGFRFLWLHPLLSGLNFPHLFFRKCKLGCNHHYAGIAASQLSSGLILPVFHTKPATGRADTMLPDVFLPNILFQGRCTPRKALYSKGLKYFSPTFFPMTRKWRTEKLAVSPKQRFSIMGIAYASIGRKLLRTTHPKIPGSICFHRCFRI